jgi:hypothetical protein
MPSSEFLQEWAWLIAVALSFGFVGLLIGLRRLQAYQAHKRAMAAAKAGEEGPSDAHANFLRARRNFLILLAIVIVFLVTLEVWNLYFYLER